MGVPVACAIVPVVTGISTVLWLRLDVHVHSVVVHGHAAHKSFSTVFALEPFVRVCHMDSLHMVFHIFHNNTTEFTCSCAVNLPLTVTSSIDL